MYLFSILSFLYSFTINSFCHNSYYIASLLDNSLLDLSIKDYFAIYKRNLLLSTMLKAELGIIESGNGQNLNVNPLLSVMVFIEDTWNLWEEKGPIFYLLDHTQE